MRHDRTPWPLVPAASAAPTMVPTRESSVPDHSLKAENRKHVFQDGSRRRRASGIARQQSDVAITSLPRFVVGPEVIVVGPAVKVRPEDVPDGEADARLIAARNEFESFQVVCRAGPSQPVHGFTVTLDGPLLGPDDDRIPEDNITIYREDYYDVQTQSSVDGAPGRWPDILIPSVDPFVGEHRNAFPIDIPPGENRVAWIDVLVPRNATPGVYEGSLAVSWSGSSPQARIIPIHIIVLDVTLPSTSSIKSAFGLTANFPPGGVLGGDAFGMTAREAGWWMNALYARAGLHNRVTLSTPQHEFLSRDSLRLFHEHTLPLLTGTAPTALPGARLTSIQASVKSDLLLWREEAIDHGFADRVFAYACDEPGSDPDNWTNCTIATSQARQAWPELPTLITASIKNIPDDNALMTVNWLVVLVNLMHDRPRSRKFGGTYRGNQRPAYEVFENLQPNNEIWLYTSCESHGCKANSDCLIGPGPEIDGSTLDPYFSGWPSYAIDAEASQARAMGWLAFLYDAVGELYFRVDHCLPSARTAQYSFGGNGDGTLFYHGDPEWIGGATPVPIESIRMKQIRDGYEDFEYLTIAESRGAGDYARRIASNLFPNMYSTIQDQRAIDMARSELARLLDPARVP